MLVLNVLEMAPILRSQLGEPLLALDRFRVIDAYDALISVLGAEMADETEDPHAQFKGVKPVEERHRLDEAALDAWMKANVEAYAGPLTINQFKGGQSNPTYQLVTPQRNYVLRKKPGGKLLPSAHAVDREFRVIAALHPTGFPVARPYALCTDDSVLGAMFYVMEMVEGRILW